MLNDRIKEKFLNIYTGSEKKDTVILDDGSRYMVKLPDPTREHALTLSYINNAYSEHVCSSIARTIGFDAQETFLDLYRARSGKTKIACVCKDFTYPNKKLIEAETIENSLDESIGSLTFESVERIIDSVNGIDKKSTKDEYYLRFIFDAFIGNPDRHNGNWGFTIDDSQKVSLAPIYDCGSALLPLVEDANIREINVQNTILSIVSALHDDQGKRIQYGPFLKTTNDDNIRKALTRFIPSVNLNEITELVNNTPFLSAERKKFYNDILSFRYNRIIIPGIEHLFNREIQKDIPAEELERIYNEFIRPISFFKKYEKHNIILSGAITDLQTMKISNKYAIICKNDICIDLLPIRSNNDELRKAYQVIKHCKMRLNHSERSKKYDQEL